MAEYSTSIDIEAPPAVVFDHLTTPDRMRAWLGQHVELEPLPGGRFAVDINGTLVRGEYIEVERPRRVVVSWGMAGSADLPPGASRVEFTLAPTAAGTTLTVLHTGLPESRAPGHAIGWRHYLPRLQAAAAGRDPGPDRGPTGTPATTKE
jgi:uncharacterized protein YndB with AHSA1/START domain